MFKKIASFLFMIILIITNISAHALPSLTYYPPTSVQLPSSELLWTQFMGTYSNTICFSSSSSNHAPLFSLMLAKKEILDLSIMPITQWSQNSHYFSKENLEIFLAQEINKLTSEMTTPTTISLCLASQQEPGTPNETNWFLIRFSNCTNSNDSSSCQYDVIPTPTYVSSQNTSTTLDNEKTEFLWGEFNSIVSAFFSDIPIFTSLFATSSYTPIFTG